MRPKSATEHFSISLAYPQIDLIFSDSSQLEAFFRAFRVMHSPVYCERLTNCTVDGVAAQDNRTTGQPDNCRRRWVRASALPAARRKQTQQNLRSARQRSSSCTARSKSRSVTGFPPVSLQFRSTVAGFFTRLCSDSDFKDKKGGVSWNFGSRTAKQGRGLPGATQGKTFYGF